MSPPRKPAIAVTPSTSTANVAMSGKVQSGVASAGGVAPAPGCPCRRSIQTVLRPSAFAGT